MNNTSSDSRPNLQTLIRTLLLAGFRIENNRRQPTHSEVYCAAPLLGTTVPLLVVVTEDNEVPPAILPHIRQAAERDKRTLVTVAATPGEDQLAWSDFLESFGGAVPSWRALSSDYIEQLEIAGRNAKPDGFDGEAWRLFETLVADGLEFSLGRRVRRLGAAKRGQKVSDMVGLLPEGSVVVVDAKATATSFDAAIHNLRALAEYTNNQRQRQKGFAEVFAALVVSRKFNQDAAALGSISREFTSHAGVPAAFLDVATLAHIVDRLRLDPSFRVAIKWRLLFAGGLVTKEMFEAEVQAVEGERY